MRIGVRVLGRFGVDIDGCAVPDEQWARRSAASLVKVLALSERRRLHREQVVDALWPDVALDRAAPRLHKAAHFVRKATGVADSVVLADQLVELFPGHDVVVDAVEFERDARDALGSGEPSAVEAALARYGGELLPDDPYESWTFHPRQRLRMRHRDLLRQARHWHDLVVVDPTDEDAHVELMRLLLDAGDRAGVRRRYDVLQRVLHDELAAEPGAEAVELWRRASDSSATAPAAATDEQVAPRGPVIPAVESDGSELTRREGEVLALLAAQASDEEIARRLYISDGAVAAHIESLVHKLDVADRRDLARRRATSAVRPAMRPLLPPALELLADDATFVGRGSERDALRRQWRLARGGHTLLVLVTGEPGIGKSRLVSELAVEVHVDGGRGLLGACYEDVDEPYGPFVQAILEDAAQLDEADVEHRAGPVAAALTRLAPQLAGRLPRREDPRPAGVADVAPAELWDGIAHWLALSAAAAPLLLVVEDLHWATATTRDALRHLVRRARRAPLLIVATARDSRPDLDADLALLLADVARAPSVSRLALRGLGRDEVARLSGAATAEVDGIVAETHGNPLLVTHLTSDAGGSLPEWLARRDDLLDDRTRAVLDQAATLGTEFDADLLAAAHETPLLAVLECLEAAEAAGLVVPRPGRRAEFAFVHALFRSARYDALGPRRRLDLHHRAARALASRPDAERLLADRARHTCLAVPLADPREAVALARVAGRQHEGTHAYDEAVALYRRAIDASQLITPAQPALVRGLEVDVAAALHHRGDPAGLPQLLAAARRAEEAGDTTSLVRAAVAIPQFGAVGFVDPMPEGRAVTEAALAAIGDEQSAARARLLMDLASHWLFVSVDEALELAARAEAVARELGDPEVLGSVLLAARHLVSHPGRIDDRVRIGSELERLGARLGRLAFTLAGIATQAAAHLERGHLASWVRGYERFGELLGERSLGFFRVQALNHDANRAFLAGDLDRAEELAERTVPWSRGIGAGRVYVESTIVANRRLQSRDEELLARFERAASRSDDAWYRCSLAAVQARSGRLAAARDTMAALREERFRIREIYPWSVAVTDLAEAAEVAGDPDVAAHVLTVARPFVGRIAVSGPSPNRPFDQALAQAALACGDLRAAASYGRRAVAASRSRQTPAFLARELVFLAEALRRDGEPAAVIRPLVHEALTISAALGTSVVAADVERYDLAG